MRNPQSLFLFIFFFSISLFNACYSLEKKVFIVYLGDKHKDEGINGFYTQSLHHSMLKGILGSVEAAKESIIYSYRRSFNGFAAMLSEEEAQKISDMEGVISVFPNNAMKLHTTRSWDFLGFPRNSYANGSFDAENVIIGMLDSGIWPESESFNDEGLGPPPSKWKGICMTADNFTCNNKIIGARYYYSMHRPYPNTKSARDSIGHGTHSASIAAGKEVKGVSHFGLAKGTSRGGVPNARIAVYKVCWNFRCHTADILAAFDDAAADGVDVISVPFAQSWALDYFNDPIAVGSFHAMKNGILTVAAAGNFGPHRGQIGNIAPWLVTVAAATIDRRFVSRLVLGNGHNFVVDAMNTFNVDNKSHPLIWGADAANYSANSDPTLSRICFFDSLNAHKVARSIVVCEAGSDTVDLEVHDAGGLGTVKPNKPYDNYARSFAFPAAPLDDNDFFRVLDYITSSKNPEATIMFSETINDTQAPCVATFSGRGPNLVTLDILKPDISGPGVNIVGAWSPIASPLLSENEYDHEYSDSEVKRGMNYNVASGTSVSCSHISAAAAYVKAVHPHWSPAAIKSALMTTAHVMDPKKHKNEHELAYGSGFINPSKAVDPGLVYNASESDYIEFLCKQGYNITKFTNTKSGCKINPRGSGAGDLNYPSFVVAVEDGHVIKASFTRTLTNVGVANSTYEVVIDVPSFVRVTVEPRALAFSAVGEQKSFGVRVRGPAISQVPIESGSITWKHGKHEVRAPLVIYTIVQGYFET